MQPALTGRTALKYSNLSSHSRTAVLNVSPNADEIAAADADNVR